MELANHSVMWAGIIQVSKSVPQAWEAVNARKAIYPKLWALLRAGAYGSSESTYPSLLPLLAVLWLQQ